MKDHIQAIKPAKKLYIIKLFTPVDAADPAEEYGPLDNEKTLRLADMLRKRSNCRITIGRA